MSKVASTATLVHGFTMADVDRLTRYAVGLAGRYSPFMDASDRWETAWHGIVEFLYESEEPPDSHDCVWAGVDAVRAEVKAVWRHHGYNDHLRGPSPAFGKFWTTVTGDREDFTGSIVERMALPQVLAVLTAIQYEALVSLANHASVVAAAESLGISSSLLVYRLKTARDRIDALWHEGETPRASVPKADVDTMCRNRHSRAEHSYKDKRDVWICRECKRSASRKSMRKARQREALAV